MKKIKISIVLILILLNSGCQRKEKKTSIKEQKLIMTDTLTVNGMETIIIVPSKKGVSTLKKILGEKEYNLSQKVKKEYLATLTKKLDLENKKYIYSDKNVFYFKKTDSYLNKNTFNSPWGVIFYKNNEFEYSDISDYLSITEKPNNITTSQSVINKCSYEKLLKNRTISVETISNNPSQNLKIIIDNKTNNNTQEINYKPYSFDFGCNSSIFNDNISLHNDYEIIAGDFNFDLLQDFAIIYDKTINTGTVFTYFFQNKKGEFYPNKEFPLKLIPTKIDKKNKTLTQQNIIGCCKIGTSIYQLKNNKWAKIFSEIKEIK